MNFKKLEPKKVVEEKKAKTWVKVSLGFVIATLVLTSAYSMYEFVNTHEFKTPIIIKFQNPTPRKAVKLESPVGSKSAGFIRQAYASDRVPTNEEYIREKFGKAGDIAVAVAKAESGLRADAYHVNTNGTIDLGVFQINTVHFEKEGCSPIDLLDFRKNVDCAYKIYEASGFNPWVAYTTGSYLNKL